MAKPAEDAPLVVPPKRARKMLSLSQKKLYELINARELDSFKEGRSRKIIVASIHRYIERRLGSAA